MVLAKRKKLKIFLIIVILIGFLLLGRKLFFKEAESVKNIIAEKIVKKDKINVGCPIKVEERIVRGNSLSGLIESGETVKVLFGYYDCYEVKRGDIILYSYSGNKNPLIKVVKGIPGDRFSFQKTKNGYYLLINGKILKNSKNEPCILNERSHKLLSLYERDYKGVIPQDAYLILGNLTSGSLDSTHFGLVGKSDILGKVVK